MMFLFDIAFATELVALGVGIVILIWSYRADKGGARGLGKVFGYFITIVAALTLISTFFHGYKYWNSGYFQKGGPQVTLKR